MKNYIALCLGLCLAWQAWAQTQDENPCSASPLVIETRALATRDKRNCPNQESPPRAGIFRLMLAEKVQKTVLVAT